MTAVTMTPRQIATTERTLSVGTWIITAGAILFSVLTVTPLVQQVTPDGWDRTAPILPIVVDAAVVIVIRLDATVSRLGGDAGRWPVVLRWLTGAMTLALNVGLSALKGDLVGVGVHSVAPLLLIVTAEASLGYRRAITAALTEIEREQRERRDRERREREDREQREREDREQQRADRERREREAREHAAQQEKERADREREERREAREHEALMQEKRAEREREERREAREHAAEQERERADREREAGERRDRAAREQRERTRRQRTVPREQQPPAPAVNTPVSPAPAVNTPKAVPADDKMAEADALAAIRRGVANGDSVRTLAEATGWSVGWVTARRREEQQSGSVPGQTELEGVAA